MQKKGHLTLTPCLLVSTGFVTAINPPQCASFPLSLRLYNNQFVCSFPGSQQTSSWGVVDPPLDYWINCTRTETGREGGRCRGIWWTWFIKHSHNYQCSVTKKYPRTGVFLSLDHCKKFWNKRKPCFQLKHKKFLSLRTTRYHIASYTVLWNS